MQGGSPASVRNRHVVFFNWRDTANPEGGGSERYVETMARGLVERGEKRWRATPKGFRFLNEILVELLPEAESATNP